MQQWSILLLISKVNAIGGVLKSSFYKMLISVANFSIYCYILDTETVKPKQKE